MEHNVVFYEKLIIMKNYFKKSSEILNETMFRLQFETQYIFKFFLYPAPWVNPQPEN